MNVNKKLGIEIVFSLENLILNYLGNKQGDLDFG